MLKFELNPPPSLGIVPSSGTSFPKEAFLISPLYERGWRAKGETGDLVRKYYMYLISILRSVYFFSLRLL